MKESDQIKGIKQLSANLKEYLADNVAPDGSVPSWVWREFLDVLDQILE